MPFSNDKFEETQDKKGKKKVDVPQLLPQCIVIK